ncbi:mCG144849, partial [Mus musculus]
EWHVKPLHFQISHGCPVLLSPKHSKIGSPSLHLPSCLQRFRSPAYTFPPAISPQFSLLTDQEPIDQFGSFYFIYIFFFLFSLWKNMFYIMCKINTLWLY